jgi:hypothetical protein
MIFISVLDLPRLSTRVKLKVLENIYNYNLPIKVN